MKIGALAAIGILVTVVGAGVLTAALMGWQSAPDHRRVSAVKASSAKLKQFEWAQAIFSRKLNVITLVVAILTYAAMLPKLGNPVTPLILAAAVLIAGVLVSMGQLESRIDDVRAALVYAQTLLPLLGSSSTSVARAMTSANEVLPPRMRAEMEAVQAQAERNYLPVADQMLLFAARENSTELDLLSGIMALAVTEGTTEAQGSIMTTVLRGFDLIIEGLYQVRRSRSGFELAGKLVAWGTAGLIIAIAYFISFGANTWSGLAGQIVTVVDSALMVGLALLFRRLSRPLASLRLISREMVEAKIERQQQVQTVEAQ